MNDPLDLQDFDEMRKQIENAMANEADADAKSSGKRRAIIEAAIRVFSEKGFSAGRTNDIAKEAGVSEGTVFNYFKSKNDLLHAILMELFISVIWPFALKGTMTYLESRPIVSVEDSLTRFAMERVELIKQNLPLLKTVLAESMFHPELMEALRDKALPSLAAIGTKIVESEIERGVFREVSGKAAIRVFMAMLFSYVMMPDSLNPLCNPGDVETDVRRIVDIFLHGVMKTPT